MHAWITAFGIALISISSSLASPEGHWRGLGTFAPSGGAPARPVLLQTSLSEDAAKMTFGFAGYVHPDLGYFAFRFEAEQQGKFLLIGGKPVGMVLGDRIFLSNVRATSRTVLSGEIEFQADRTMKLNLELIEPEHANIRTDVTGTLQLFP